MTLWPEALLLVDPAAPARYNMAIDEALLDCVAAMTHPRPILRAFQWSDPDPISIGIFQSHPLPQPLPDGSPAITRRPTGGGTVNHRMDQFTWSACLPTDHTFKAMGNLASVYSAFQLWIANWIQSLGGPQCSPHENARTNRPNQCFHEPVVGDLIREDGAKVSGIAVARTRGVLLLQGSLQNLPELGAIKGLSLIRHLGLHLAMDVAEMPISSESWIGIDRLSLWVNKHQSQGWLFRK